MLERQQQKSSSNVSKVREEQRAESDRQAEQDDSERIRKAEKNREEISEDLDEILDHIDKELQEQNKVIAERRRAEGLDLMRQATAQEIGELAIQAYAVTPQPDRAALFGIETRQI